MNSLISSTDAQSPGAPTLAPTSRRLGVEPQLAADALERPHQPIAKRRDDGKPASTRKGLAISARGSGSGASSRPGSGRPACATGRSSLDELLDAIESWLSNHQGPVPKVRKGRPNPPLTASQPGVDEDTTST